MNVEPLKQSVDEIGDWKDLQFFCNGEFEAVCDTLSNDERTIVPAAGNVLRAFRLVQPHNVRVVILGQDPYPNPPDHAIGLAFGVPVGTDPLPPSLRNIFAKVKVEFEVPAETAARLKENCELTGWAAQGVLLLNTVLTVTEKCPNAHKDIGWGSLIKQATELLARRTDIAWLTFGNQAREHLPGNIQNQEMVVQSRHPARSLPQACRLFSRIDELLGERPIDWLNT